MEKVLDVYKRPYNSMRPVVCMDESPKQLIGETRVPIPMSKGHDRKCDYEYERLGVCNIFLANECRFQFNYIPPFQLKNISLYKDKMKIVVCC